MRSPNEKAMGLAREYKTQLDLFHKYPEKHTAYNDGGTIKYKTYRVEHWPKLALGKYVSATAAINVDYIDESIVDIYIRSCAMEDALREMDML